VRHSYVDARPGGTPRIDRPLVLADGRLLQIAEWGPPEGYPVVFFHGQPGSRLFCPDVAATDRAGVRCICFDRPGYGRSDPSRRVPSYASAVAVVVEVLDQLDIGVAAVIGWSGGGPHALACGALASRRVSTVTTVCAVSGPEVGTSDDPELIDLERAVLVDPVSSRDQVRARATQLLGDRAWVTRMTERFDPTVFDAPNMRALYQASWDEASAVSIEGVVDDWILNTRPWAFELAGVDRPVFVWFGEQDPLVARSHAETFAAELPHSESFGCSECRHYVPVAHWPQILEQVTSDRTAEAHP
jgi:pimeloyl-ACP methyl ester carboxylesterase